MFNRIRSRRLLPFAALALATLLGGCYYGGYPGYYGSGYYGSGYYGGGGGYYGAPYYSGATVAIGTGWGWRGHDHDGGWRGGHDGEWRR